VAFASTGTGAAPVLQSVETRLDGAGCHFEIDGAARNVLIVAFRPIEHGTTSVARVRIADIEHRLDWTERSPTGWIFRGESESVEVDDMTEIEPVCRGSECEGSHYRARLTVVQDGERTRLDTRAHCGA
jgi:hypothetical protein